MGLTIKQQNKSLTKLSGGRRARVSLSRALFMKPDLLLFDEPTNHLDLPAILWLRNFLNSEIDPNETTLVMISHDKAFLNATCNRIIHFRNDFTLAYFKGDYNTFEQTINDKNTFNQQLSEKIQVKEKNLKETIAKSTSLGHKNSDDNLLKLAAQRKKKIDRVGNEKNENGFRFKLNCDRAEFHFTVRDQADEQQIEKEAKWGIPQPVLNVRSNIPLISLENVSFKYSGSEINIIENINFCLRNGECVVLIGRNGCGKSTIMNLIN